MIRKPKAKNWEPYPTSNNHYFIDFISGYARPFLPFSNKEVFLGIISDKARIYVEISLTIILGWYFWISL